jgi:hypothetical protein
LPRRTLSLRPKTSVLRCWEDKAASFIHYPLSPLQYSKESLGLCAMPIFIFIKEVVNDNKTS